MGDLNHYLQRVQSIFTEDLGLSVPSANTDLFEEGLLDSLSFIDLLTLLESRFGLQVEVEQLEFDNFRTIDRIVGFIVAHRSQTRPDAPRANPS